MNHRPRKRFGQNFLHDPNIIERIVRAIRPRAGQHMVEIGPGQGALTAPLLEAVEHMDAVELDRDLVAHLQTRFSPEALTLHSIDALKFDFCSLVGDGPGLRVVGNLPYNISTPLIFHLLEGVHCIEDMHFMLQREVVQRMAASAGSPDYGRLSVMVQVHCAVENLFSVPPGAFHPPPKVFSAIVRLTPHAEPPVAIRDHKLFARLVAQAFSQRRKTLRNTLKPLLEAGTIEALGIDPTRRAETLELAEFAALANAVGETGP